MFAIGQVVRYNTVAAKPVARIVDAKQDRIVTGRMQYRIKYRGGYEV